MHLFIYLCNCNWKKNQT